MNKAKKQQRAVKQKLIAAIAMLMVSAIMVVSSSYAWFTLSTAPEVTGIQTSVGANGNLEMALNNGGTITSGTTDSILPALEKNITWGNLVDLSQGYGLDLVKLMPSRLAISGQTLQQSMLQVPVYGADGRVERLTNVSQGLFASNTVPVGNGNGVRLFGTSASMSDEQLALRDAKMNFGTSMSGAANKAASTLTINGGALADMAIAHGLDDNAEFTLTQVRTIESVILAMESAAEDLETALKYAVKAAATAEAGGHAFNVEGKTLTQVIADFGTQHSTLVDSIDYVNTYATKVATMKTNINAAKTTITNALTTKPAGPFIWNDFSAAIGALMDSSKINVNGLSLAQVKANPGDLATKYFEDREILMNVPTEAGIFADIADFTGNYSASITIPQISYGDSINLSDVPAKMRAITTVDPIYKEAINTEMAAIQPSSGIAAASLSDRYAYAIDLAFRTNAADSNLLLQTDATDRIYEDNTLGTTMGGGSYMQFTLATGYKLETAKALMNCIRVVFMSTNNGDPSATAPTIYKVAVLDVDSLTTVEGGAVKVPLKIAQHEFINNELVIKTDAQGKVLFAKDGEEYDPTIKSLNQNVQENVTALVYLDGNKADNSVVANGVDSLSGHMNLQFSSSATLVPMEYSDLHVTGNTPTTTASTPAATETTAAAQG